MTLKMLKSFWKCSNRVWCHDLQELSKTYHQVALARKRLADTLLNHYLSLYFPEVARYWEATRRMVHCFSATISHARGHSDVE